MPDSPNDAVKLTWFLALCCCLCGCAEQDVTLEEETGPVEIGREVAVTADGETAAVGLSTIEPVTWEGEAWVSLPDVLQASELVVTWEERTYDFLASDGYTPSSRECWPVDYATLVLGYVHTESGNLDWDESAGLPGCYYVTSVVEVLVQDAE